MKMLKVCDKTHKRLKAEALRRGITLFALTEEYLKEAKNAK